jgi:hypothetical protein
MFFPENSAAFHVPENRQAPDGVSRFSERKLPVKDD